MFVLVAVIIFEAIETVLNVTGAEAIVEDIKLVLRVVFL